MNPATFFITTARSGTQWLAASLHDTYSDMLEVEHEPVKYAYAPRRCLRSSTELQRARQAPVIRNHFDRIHRTLKVRPYVEVGFPAFASAPLLFDEFGDRLRLVHLTRHPARVAASIVTHHWFDGARPDIEADIAPTPLDPGVRLRSYSDSWADMQPFEKALYYWTEVNLYALEVSAILPTVPLIRLSFEDLLARREARLSLTQFLGLPYRPAFDDAPDVKRDKYRQRTTANIDPELLTRVPEAVLLAERLGYEQTLPDVREFKKRYRTPWLVTTKRRLRSALGKVKSSASKRGRRFPRKRSR